MNPEISIHAATELIEKLAAQRDLLKELPLEERTRLLKAAGSLYFPDINERRRIQKTKKRNRKAEKINRDQATLSKTGIRVLRSKPVFTTPNLPPPPDVEPKELDADSEPLRVLEAQNCYTCKKDYSTIHHFYDQLCPPCAELNFKKRTELADLRGRVALLTGGRVKIGYQAGIKLLRSGAHLIVTTRFPKDSASRYAEEPDFSDWADRLEIFGLDLRHTPSVEAFCRHLLETRRRLDFIINNACQTVRRPPDFYQHMMEKENRALSDWPEKMHSLLGAYEGLREANLLPESSDAKFLSKQKMAEVAGLTHSSQLSQIPLLPDEVSLQKDLFPEGRLDQDLQQIDLRESNSWRLRMSEVPTVELLEVHLVNAVAPFLYKCALETTNASHT